MAPMGVKDSSKPGEKKDGEKKKRPEVSPEMKELIAREKALAKVEAPDRTATDKQCDDITEEVNALQEKMKAVNAKIAVKSVGKDEYKVAKDAIREKLNELTSKIDELEEQKKKLQGSVKAKQEEGRSKQNELRSLKKKLGFDTVEDLDAEIRKVEYEMQTKSMTLKEEKDVLKQLAEMRRSKPQIAKLAQVEVGAGAAGDVSGIKTGIDELYAQLSELREAKKLQSEANRKLTEARQKVMAGATDLFKEKDETHQAIRAKFDERSAIRKANMEKKKEYDEYWNKVRDLRGERAKLEREARNAEWEAERKAEKEAEGPGPLPFAEELMLLSNLVKYAKSLLPKEEAKEEESKEVLDTTLAGAGHLMLVNKKDRDEEFFFAPTKKKGLKKSGGKKAKPFVHNLQTLGYFDKFAVPPPVDATQIPAALEVLEKKVAEYTKKQEKKLAGEAKKEEAKADAAEEAKEEEKKEE